MGSREYAGPLRRQDSIEGPPNLASVLEVQEADRREQAGSEVR